MDSTTLRWGSYSRLAIHSRAVAAGGLLDRWHLRWAHGFGVVAWSLVAALTATAVGYASLVVFRLLLGVTQIGILASCQAHCGALAASAGAVAREWPVHQGTSIGALIAPALTLGLSSWVGWRWTFAAIGGLGGLWFALRVRLTRDPVYRPVWVAESQSRPRAGLSRGTSPAAIPAGSDGNRYS